MMVVLWASVSDETDARLRAAPGQRIRLRPDEWKSGSNLWIVDVVGEPRAVGAALTHLANGPLKNKDVAFLTRDDHGAPKIDRLVATPSNADAP